MQPLNEPSGRTYFRAMSILHLAFVGGLTFFALIAALMVFSRNAPIVFSLAGNLRFIVALGLMILAVPSVFVFKAMLQKCLLLPTLTGKLNAYRTAFILKLALLEGPALLAIVAFMLTGEPLILAAAGCLILYFLLQKPSFDKAVAEMGLSDEERLRLDRDAPVSSLE